MKKYKQELGSFLGKWYYTGFVLFIALLGYGYGATHPVVNIDTLLGDYYVGSGQVMLRSGRFGMTLWSRITGYGTSLFESSYIISVMAVVMLIWAAVHFCILFRRASGDRISMPAYTVFSACLVSYPLMNEIWEYQGANLIVCGGYWLASVALLLIDQQLRQRKIDFWMSVAAVGALTIVCSSYESLVPVYVFGVFCVLLVQELQLPDWKKHLKQGLIYCLVLILGLLMRILCHKLILLLWHLTPMKNGDTKILWLESESILKQLRYLIGSVVNNHFLAGFVYFPVGVFVICVIAVIISMIWNLVHKRVFAGLLEVGMLFSLEILSILQGYASYYRTCQVFALLVAFTCMMAANRLRFKNAAAFALCFLCLHQSVYLSRISVLNSMRFEEEKQVIQNVGLELTAHHDLSKPVVFVGHYALNENITSQTEIARNPRGYLYFDLFQKKFNDLFPQFYVDSNLWHLPANNIQSILNWGMLAYGSQEQMENLFGFFGYCIETMDNMPADQEEAERYARVTGMPSYPRDGYIAELDDHIVVKLGDINS